MQNINTLQLWWDSYTFYNIGAIICVLSLCVGVFLLVKNSDTSNIVIGSFAIVSMVSAVFLGTSLGGLSLTTKLRDVIANGGEIKGAQITRLGELELCTQTADTYREETILGKPINVEVKGLSATIGWNEVNALAKQNVTIAGVPIKEVARTQYAKQLKGIPTRS